LLKACPIASDVRVDHGRRLISSVKQFENKRKSSRSVQSFIARKLYQTRIYKDALRRLIADDPAECGRNNRIISQASTKAGKLNIAHTAIIAVIDTDERRYQARSIQPDVTQGDELQKLLWALGTGALQCVVAIVFRGCQAQNP
jgi:hypothetical protein